MNLQELLGDAYREDMTVEEIEKAISEKNFEDNSKTISNLRESLNKATSEASKYKKQLNEHLSQEEKDKQAREEQNESIMKELETLRKEKAISSYKAKLLSLGYDEKLADDTAKAMLDGDMDRVFTNQGIFAEAKVASAKKELVKETPHPHGTTGGKQTITKDDLLNMDVNERGKFIRDHREEYMALHSETKEGEK